MREDVRENVRRAGLLSVIVVISFRLSQFGARGRGVSARVIRFLAAPLGAVTRTVLGAELPGALACGERLVLPHGGRGVVVSPGARLGDDVCLMHQVTIGDAVPHRGSPVLGDGVFVGVKASVLGDVSVGRRAVVGAHALVLASVPEATLVVGVPAAVVGDAPVIEARDASADRRVAPAGQGPRVETGPLS
jgi:serine acetyltransferase